MRLTILILLICKWTALFSQTIAIKVRKDAVSDSYTDSVFYDPQERAFYSKTSGYSNRFKTLKQCNVIYESKKSSGTVKLRSNKLTTNVLDLFNKKTRKMTVKFTDIVLKADSLNSKERKCPSIIMTFYRKPDYHFYYGARFKCPWPFPTWQTTNATIEYGP